MGIFDALFGRKGKSKEIEMPVFNETQKRSLKTGEQFGANGVEISAHALCAPDHLPYQGKQFSHAEFKEIQAKLKRPIGGEGCRHSIFPIVLGISEPAHSKQQLAEYRRNSQEKIVVDGVTKSRYRWTQELRKIEDTIREQKEIAVAAQAAEDKARRYEAQAKINASMKTYDRISEATGLYKDTKRMAVSGYRAVKIPDT